MLSEKETSSHLLSAATSVSDARWGNAESNTTLMLFIFKRRKADTTSTATGGTDSS